MVPEPDMVYAPQEAIFRATTKHNVGSELLVRTYSETSAMVIPASYNTGWTTSVIGV